MRMSKQVDTLGSPRAMSVPLPLRGVGSSVMKLTRKVSKQRCLSFSCRSFIILPRSSDRPRRPVGPPWTGVSSSGHSMVLPGEAESRLHAGLPWFSRPGRISGGPCLGNRPV